MSTCILPSAYLAPIDFYSQLLHHDKCMTEVCDYYEKQTYRNRCVIAAANGPLPLTIPIVKPTTQKAPMRDIRISDHGNWRHLHWNALQSAYSKSPFFEYYADDFEPFYTRKWEFLADFNEEMQQMVCALIDLHTTTERTTEYALSLPDGVEDMRQLVRAQRDAVVTPRPYYQVFRQTHGFLPNLSIVDLLFNEGPESILFL